MATVPHGPHHDVQPADRDPPRLLAARRTSPPRRPPSTSSPAVGSGSTSSPGRTTSHQYGDVEGDQAQRYARTKEFMRLVRRLWTEEKRDLRGRALLGRRVDRVTAPRSAGDRSTRASTSAAPPRPPSGSRPPSPTCSCSGASRWTASASGSTRLKGLEQSLERDLPPLEFGLRITTLVRDTTEEAWHDAEEKVAKMAEQAADDTFRQVPAQPASRRPASSGCSTWPSAATSWTPASTPRPASTAAAARAPPGWSARPRTWPTPAQVPGPRHHALRALGHAVPDRDRPGRRPDAAAAA